MTRANASHRGNLGRLLLILAIVAIVVIVLAPAAVASGAGRLVADLWVTVMAAVAGLIGGLFGA